MLRPLILVCLIGMVAACGEPARPPLLGQAPGGDIELARSQVLRALRELERAPLEVRGVEFDPDPVGYLRAVYWAAGVDLFEPEVATDPTADGWTVIEASARRRGQLHRATPRQGDLALFREKNGRLFMAAVVTDVTDDAVSLRGWFSLGPEGVEMPIRVSKEGEGTFLAAGETLRDAFAGYVDPFRLDPFR